MRREIEGRGSETVCLLTSAPPERLDAAEWLKSNRAGWGIENGLHARLDVSRHDDSCRLRNKNAVWVHGIFSRLANSLFMEWRSHWPKPHHKTTTDFSSSMGANHCRRAILTVTSKRPSLKPAS